MISALTTTLGFLENWQVGLVDTAALAAVALIGYLFGHRTREEQPDTTDPQLLNELSRVTDCPGATADCGTYP